MFKRSDVKNMYIISPMQQGILYHCIMNNDSSLYFIQVSVTIDWDMNLDILNRSFDYIIQRHDVLRTIFIYDKVDQPIQVVLKERKGEVFFRDISTLPDNEKLLEIENFIKTDRKKDFDLMRDILIRLSILKTGEMEYRLIWSFHHIIMDGWCMGIVMEEFSRTYECLNAGRKIEIKEEQPYSSFIKWLAAQDQEEAKVYWKEYLEGYEQKTELPFRKRQDNKEGCEPRRKIITLGKELTKKLRVCAREKNVTLSIIFQGIWGLLLARYNNEEDVVFGNVVSGRPSEIEGVESMVGLFINTIPVRIRIKGKDTFGQFVEEIQKAALESGRYDYYPLSEIQSNSGLRRELFDHIFVFENYPLNETILSLDNKNAMGFKITDINMFEQTNYGFNISATDGMELKVTINYNSEMYDEKFIELIEGHLKRTAELVTDNMDIRLKDIDILTEREKQQILVKFNDTKAEYPRDKAIHELFEEQVKISPDNIAVVYEESSMTYKELNRKANRLARTLVGKGVKKDSVVGILSERSVDMLVSIMSVLKAGGAYMPISPEYPDERIKYMLQNSGSNLVLAQQQFIGKIELGSEVICINDEKAYDGDYTNLKNTGSPESLAYVIYTSGSTGKPKGVMIEHSSVLNLVSGLNQEIYKRYDTNMRVALIAPYVFDSSVKQIFAALLLGHSLYVVPEEARTDGNLLAKYYVKNNIDISDGTPAHIKLLLNSTIAFEDGVKVRHFIIGGEILPYGTVKSFIEKFKWQKPYITNVYGPTECCVDSTAYLIDTEEVNSLGIIPIGKPIANTKLYILDSHMKSVPPGVAGEIYIAGAGVGRGYLNAPVLTKERFMENPFVSGERMYRTGDLGKWKTDGNIEFIGRIDYQVKVRGYRIELGEIENSLLSYKCIKEAVVAAKEDGNGSKYLCAYIVGEKELKVSELREYLGKLLPDYMIPSYFIQLDKMLLTSNGKIDRKALPEPDGNIETGTEYEAPRNGIEEKLVNIWQEVLGIREIGINDNFFELGGHSLKATSMVSKIHKQLNVEVPLREVFKTPTIKGLAEYIKEQEKNIYSDIEPVEEKEYYELSSAQKRLYTLQQFDLESTGYNMPGVLEIEGKLDVARLEEAFSKLIKRHEAFRTSFELIGEEIVQKIHKEVEFKVEHKEAREEDVEEILRGFIRPFDLSKAPLLRVGLIKLHTERHILMHDMHHIISDGTSMGILIDEFVKLYEGKVLSPLRLQYKDYAAWQNSMLKSGTMKKQEEYWLKTFEGEIPVLSLHTDYQRPAIQSFEGDRIHFELDEEITKGLRRIVKEMGATMYMVLLAGFNILLSRYSGQEEIVVGSPIAGRPHADLENIMGMFVNTLAMRNYPSGEKTIKEFIEEVKTNALRAYENQDYQFEEFVEKLNIRRDMSRNLLFDVMFAMQNMDMAEMAIEGISIKPHEMENRISKFDITLTAVEVAEKIGLSIEYSNKLFSKETIERMAGHLKNVLKKIDHNVNKKICEIDILDEEERHKLLYEFNDTYAEYPKDKTIHELFEEQAARTPDNIAVVFGNRRIKYSELNKKADILAGVLRRKGVNANKIAGIMTGQSLEMIIGVMGILKAGGAYLPIDSKYPERRIRYMLEDSEAVILLKDKHLDINFSFKGEVMNLDIADLQEKEAVKPECKTSSNDAAYLIYTSGTTGKPKGILVEHRALVNLCEWHNRSFNILQSDRAMKYAGFSFDASVGEIFPYLIKGACLYIVEESTRYDIGKLNGYMKSSGITVAFLPTQLCEQFMSMENLSLRILLTGGDKLRHWENTSYKIINNYGPTENTVVTTSCVINKQSKNIPIGKPISNVKVYILDKWNMLRPAGVPGELCISGDGLARGYLNRPEFMKEKFVDNPFEPGKRMYRTGDRARWLIDGNIEFLGRMDSQVKIRGFRIELGEVEKQLLSYEGIRETVAIAREDSGGSKYICAYVAGEKELKVTELRKYLKKELPEYMIPSYFVQLDKLPLTPNGKLDRKGLPDPEVIRNTDIDYKAPRNEIDEKLVKIWQEVLGVEKIGINDNFFELGGHSLKATSMASKIYKELNVEVPLREVFKTPAIKGISEYIAISKHSKYKAIEVADERDYYPVSSAQNRLWILKQANDNDTGYNMTQIISIEGKLDREMVEAAFKKLIERHEILKTSFEYINAMPVQKVNKDAKLDISYTEAKEGIDGIITSFIKPFDLRKAPLLRALLIQIEKDKHIMAFDMHHIISDGLSMNIITKEFADLYQGRELPEQRIQYKDYCIWHNDLLESGILRGQEEYWKKKLDNFIYTELPKKNTTFQGKAKGARKELKLDKETTAKIEKYCKKANITQFTFMLSIFKLIISKYSGQNDITVGIPVAGRNYADLDNMVGLFLNVLIIRTEIKMNLSFGEYLNMVEENILEAQDNQDYPYEKLYAHLKETINFNRPSIFSILFNYMPYQNVSYDFGDIAIKPYEIDAISPKYDITLYLRESDEISMSLVYKDNLYDGFLIESILDNYSTLINILLDNDNMLIRQIDLGCGSAIEEGAPSWDEYLDNSNLI